MYLPRLNFVFDSCRKWEQQVRFVWQNICKKTLKNENQVAHKWNDSATVIYKERNKRAWNALFLERVICKICCIFISIENRSNRRNRIHMNKTTYCPTANRGRAFLLSEQGLQNRIDAGNIISRVITDRQRQADEPWSSANKEKLKRRNGQQNRKIYVLRAV